MNTFLYFVFVDSAIELLAIQRASNGMTELLTKPELFCFWNSACRIPTEAALVEGVPVEELVEVGVVLLNLAEFKLELEGKAGTRGRSCLFRPNLKNHDSEKLVLFDELLLEGLALAENQGRSQMV